MAQCVQLVSTSVVTKVTLTGNTLAVTSANLPNWSVVSPQPSDISTCPYVMETGAEVVVNASGSPWRMTTADATLVGAAIAAVWVTVAVIKVITAKL